MGAVFTELSVFSGASHSIDEEGDDPSYASRGVESEDGDSRSASRSTSKKAPALKQKEAANDKRCMWWFIRKDDVEAKQA